jgi:hypothetical protein
VIVPQLVTICATYVARAMVSGGSVAKLCDEVLSEGGGVHPLALVVALAVAPVVGVAAESAVLPPLLDDPHAAARPATRVATRTDPRRLT